MNWLRKNIRYFVLTLFLITNGVIIAESSLSGGPSGSRSSLIALILSVFVNKSTPPVTPSFVTVESLNIVDRSGTEVSEASKYYIPLGVTRRLLTTVLPENATDKNVTWTTSNPEVVDVYPGGLLEARTIGENVVIKAIPSNSAKTISFFVTVHEKEAPPTFEANLEKETIEEGITTKVIITADEINYDIKKLKYYTEDETIATVNEYGIIKGISAGHTNIGVIGSDIKLQITVTSRTSPLVEPSTIYLDMPSIGYVYGKSPFTYRFDVEDVSDPSVTFVSSDETIARIIKEDDSYFLYGYKIRGTVTITAYLNSDFSIDSSHTLTFEEVAPTSLTLSTPKNEFSVGTLLNISALLGHDIAEYPDLEVTDKRLTFSSSDESIARVTPRDTGAQVVGLKVGTVTITAKSYANPALSEEIELKIVALPFINDQNFSNFQMLVRKALGHFTLFFVNGVFGFLTFYLFLKDNKLIQIIIGSLSVGLFFASVSELIQRFVPGRAGTFTDVLINFSGYLVATLLLLLITYLVLKRKAKKDARP